MEGITLQSLLFAKIDLQLSPQEKLIDEVAKVLNLSSNATYKRIKGITALNLDDLIKLATHFKISLDSLILKDRESVIFRFSQLNHQPTTYTEYLQPLVQLASLVDHFPNEKFKVNYATNELPIFHYSLFKELNFFKYYTWAWSVWEFENTKYQKVSFEKPIDNNDQFLFPMEKIENAYYQIESTEFLSETALHNTIQQIKYFISINRFEKIDDALKVCNSLRQLFKHMFQMAEAGKKFKPGEAPMADSPNYHLFHNEITQSNNVIVLESPVGNHAFASYDNPNLLHTEDDRMVDYTLDWFGKLKKRSISLSRETERNRIRFFDLMFQQLEKGEKEIKLMVSR